MRKMNDIPFNIRLQYGCYQFFDHFLGRDRFFKWTRNSRTKFYEKLEKKLKESGEGKLIPVDRVKNISKKDLFKNYIRKGIPVVIEGAAKEWACTKEWSLAYFKDLHGDDKIIFMDQTDITTYGYEETTLGKVIDNIRDGGSKYYRFYPLLKKHPEHLLDFDYKWLRERRRKFSFGEAFHVFISGKGGFTPIHNASSENIFTQVYGEKKWVLYPMEVTCVIDPSPARNFYRSAPIRDGKDFNAFKLNYKDYPLFKYVNGYSVHLKAGDVLYNPPYMWHTIENPTDSIGVGYRSFSPLQTIYNYPLYFFLELFAFNPPFWKSWRNYDDANLLHMIESGNLDELAKKRGVKKIKETVS